MILQGQCQHCAGLYEYEAGSKSEFCPHCGKETFCAAPPASGAAKARTQPANKKAGGAILLDVGAAVLLIVGCFMVADGCAGAAAEQHPEAGAIRQITATVEAGLGVVVISLSLILAALVRIIRKP